MATTKTITQLPAGATIYTDTRFAVESNNTTVPDETQRVTISQLADQTTIKNPSGVLKVDQPSLTGLTGSLNSTGNTMKVTVNAGTQSAGVNIVNSNTLTYTSGTLEGLVNGIVTDVTVDGTTIPASNPVTTTTTSLDTSLADIYAAISGGSGIIPVGFATSTYTITTEQFLIYTGTANTVVTLPSAVGITYPIRIVCLTTGTSVPKLTIETVSSQTITVPTGSNTLGTGTSFYTTKKGQVIELYSTGTQWVKVMTGRGYQGTSANDTLQFSTRQLLGSGAFANYTLLNGGRFTSTIIDNTAIISFKVEIEIGGTPTSPLTTNIELTELLDSFNYTSTSQCVGFSKCTAEVATSGDVISSDFFNTFETQPGEKNIAAQTLYIPAPAFYRVYVQLHVTLF